jgi:hypothetical protein
LRITAAELLWHKFLTKRDRPDKMDSAKMKRPSKIFNPMFKTQTLKAAELENKAADYRRLKSTPVNSPELISDSEGEEADTPGIYGEGKEEAGAEPKQFNQVMLQAQNRMILIAVLSDQKEEICDEVLAQLQTSRESRKPKLEKNQLFTVMSALGAFARNENSNDLDDELAQLSSDCSYDHLLRDDVEQSCFYIPSAVTAANKRHGTPPHCVFAIDDIVHRGVHCILSVLSPDSVKSSSEKPTPTKSPSQMSLIGTPQTTPTSSVDAKEINKHLRLALDENLQLLRDMNDILRHYVSEFKGQPSIKKRVTFQTTDSDECVDGPVAVGNSDLVAWLEEIQLDQPSIQRFVAEKLTLRDVQDHMTRADVIDLKLKIGPRCRVWAAITEYRSSNSS